VAKQDVHYTTYLTQTLRALSHDGALLVACDSSGQANPMTIGWGTFGWIWGKPVVTVLVRPSRYSYELLEQVKDFTVNIPPRSLAETVAYCGSVSGRHYDKFTERGLTAGRSRHVKAPIVEECVLHFECRVVNVTDLEDNSLAPVILESNYAHGDLHRVFYGEILATYADADARATLVQENIR
jgi:flavin reductase (DIM6/NTAB) family NADH-FMN oxidoreductase RutF